MVPERGVEHAAVLFGGAVQRDGVAAQAEGHGKGEVLGHRQAERAQRGEAAADDLGDGDEVGVVAGAVVVDGLDRGEAGQGDVAGGDAEEDRREEGGDEVQQDVAGQ